MPSAREAAKTNSWNRPNRQFDPLLVVGDTSQLVAMGTHARLCAGQKSDDPRGARGPLNRVSPAWRRTTRTRVKWLPLTACA